MANVIPNAGGKPAKYREVIRAWRRPKRKGIKMLKISGVIVGLLVIGIGNSALAATVVKQEPPMGAMREGEVLLVDDGSCPAGKIKRVVGGNHTAVGGTKQIVRTKSCVQR